MAKQKYSFEVESQFSGRLDKYLKEKLPHLSRSFIQKIIKNGGTRVDGQVVVKPGTFIEAGQLVDFEIEITSFEIKPEKINLKILFEDDNLLVIDKKTGITILPDRFHQKGTILGFLMFYLKKDAEFIAENLIVHRLDKGTSGVLLVAKNKETGEFLKQQFKLRKVKKKYLVCCVGKLYPEEAIIDAEIGRHPSQPYKMAVVPDGEGKRAITYYKVLKYFDNFSFVEVWPKTGRTHQIRVHLAAIGYPIVGDQIYGGKKAILGLKRPFLHANLLTIKHPKTKQKITFESPLPRDLKSFLKKLEHGFID